MFPLALSVLLLFTFFDSQILKRKDALAYRSIFQVQTNVWISFILIIGFTFIFDPFWWESLTSFIVVFVFPIYFLKRHLFMKSVEKDELFIITTNGLCVLLFWFFGILIFSTIFYIFTLYYGKFFGLLEEMVLSAVFSSILLVWLIERNARIFSPHDFWESVGFSRENISFVRKIFVPVLIGLVMAYFSASLITGREFQPSTPLSEALENKQSMWSIPLFVFLALVVAPIVEEITFRGFFFEVIKRVKGQRVAFYVVSLTFGMLHMAQYWGDWVAIIVIMIMGFCLTFVRIWAGTNAASVWMHYFYNLGVVVIAAWMEVSKEIL